MYLLPLSAIGIHMSSVREDAHKESVFLVVGPLNQKNSVKKISKPHEPLSFRGGILNLKVRPLKFFYVCQCLPLVYFSFSPGVEEKCK